MNEVPAVRFEQYKGSGQHLYIFSADALTLGTWSGVPRKAPRLRMLYQRIFGKARETEIANYWNAGFQQSPVSMVIPTAIIVALRTPSNFDSSASTLNLAWTPPVEETASSEDRLRSFAREFLNDLLPRFAGPDAALVRSMADNPGSEIPQAVLESHWLLESALHVAKMASDPHYAEKEGLTENELNELVLALDQVTRPALVVDGQHRLLGALASERPADIRLPVVAIEDADWLDQAFQFIVINETAKPVDSAVLTDIIGSSVTPPEAEQLRQAINSTNLKIEERIAATVVDRDVESPFHNMVELRLWRAEDAPPGNRPFKSATIDRLVNSPIGPSRAWRTDGDFFEEYVAPSGWSEEEWSNSLTGAWKAYFYAFWVTIREAYSGDPELWDTKKITPLTKALMLRSIQTAFMQDAIRRARDAVSDMELIDAREQSYREKYDPDSDTLRELLEALSDERRTKSNMLPETTGEFKSQVAEFFADLPRKFFERHLTFQDAGKDRDAVMELIAEVMDKERRGVEWRRSGSKWADQDYVND